MPRKTPSHLASTLIAIRTQVTELYDTVYGDFLAATSPTRRHEHEHTCVQLRTMEQKLNQLISQEGGDATDT